MRARQSTIRALRVAATGTFVSFFATVFAQAQVTVSPGQNIQAAVNNHAAGTTFTLTPGVYRNQAIVPKQGDIFVGQTGVYLNGSTVLTRFSQSGSLYLSYISVPQISAGGFCQSNRSGCTLPEDLFYDGRRLERVYYSSQVVPGKWAYSYSNGTVYMANYPWGHTVEISTSRHAFSGGASGVVIRGLHIQKYANPAQDGTIDCGPSWTVENSEVSYNHGVGILINSNDQIVDNYVHHQGQIGISGSGNNILVHGNEVAYNNTAGYSFSWEAGGVKVTNSNALTISSNYSHDNQGPGLHTDYNNYNTLYDSNHTARNLVAGIQHEISFSAVIRNNYIESDGHNPNGSSGWWGSGIRVLASPNVQVYGNTLLNCMNGIIASQTNRGSSSYEVQNLWVHNNTVTQSTGAAAGIVSDSQFEPMIFTSWNNHFNSNTYHLSSLSGAYFDWQNSTMSFTSWRNHGNDTSGSAGL